MKKVYAVRIGRKTGIFSTWEECEAQVKGFAGAKFKGFSGMSEALAWLGMGSPSTEKKKIPAAGRNNKSAAIPMREKKETFSSADPFMMPAEENVDYVIYTDGSCLRNPDGPGGWAAVLLKQGTKETIELHKGSPSTTNNRMELSAAIEALSAIEEGSSALLYTDSQYMKNAFTKHWITNWKRNGWKTVKGTDVLNKDLWLRLDALFLTRKVRFRWVKGHVGVKYNERCDALAKAEAMRYMKTS